eukprot:TRINITY_DN13625_c0_g2_i1.p2 TRINITY_DN13625_c0_g2~~TRINITY_DN13625_c0_g2_i1.p2  ORF type:complete len:424 (+),score=159.80 TRINITY_DN13625_c0_g2_i1:78-1274(+)
MAELLQALLQKAQQQQQQPQPQPQPAAQQQPAQSAQVQALADLLRALAQQQQQQQQPQPQPQPAAQQQPAQSAQVQALADLLRALAQQQQQQQQPQAAPAPQPLPQPAPQQQPVAQLPQVPQMPGLAMPLSMPMPLGAPNPAMMGMFNPAAQFAALGMLGMPGMGLMQPLGGTAGSGSTSSTGNPVTDHLFAEWKKAKAARDYATADSLRQQMRDRGFEPEKGKGRSTGSSTGADRDRDRPVNIDSISGNVIRIEELPPRTHPGEIAAVFRQAARMEFGSRDIGMVQRDGTVAVVPLNESADVDKLLGLFDGGTVTWARVKELAAEYERIDPEGAAEHRRRAPLKVRQALEEGRAHGDALAAQLRLAGIITAAPETGASRVRDDDGDEGGSAKRPRVG